LQAAACNRAISAAREVSREARSIAILENNVCNPGHGTSTQLLSVELKTAHGSLAGNSGGLVVALKSGRKIEVHRGFDVSTLQRLVSILERV